MQVQILNNFLKLTFALFLMGGAINSFAQITWDGGGDGTSWEMASNWNPDMVPPADSLVLINMDATITGTAAVAPIRITISGSAVVTLDLNLSVGNGIADDHSIILNTKSTLNLGGNNNPTFILNPTDAKQGIAAFGSADSTTLNVLEGTTINILRGTNGINFANNNSWINNAGTINCESDVKNGIKSKASFSNTGTINLNNVITDGILIEEGTFENLGSITGNKAGEDCIEIIGGATFSNFGTMDLIAKDSAGSANNAIALGSDVEVGIFINESGGVVNADGGDKDTGRAISVNEMGDFTNNGDLSLTGGGDGSRIYNRGTTTNGMNATIDLTDGRINVNEGTLTNNGLIKSVRGSSGIFSNENTSLINNGFYKYLGSGNFSSGTGDITDNGISLFQSGLGVIDAEGSCTADIAEQPYEWFKNNNLIATADATGSITFEAESLTTDSVTLKTTLDSVRIKVRNICVEAVIPDSTTSIINLHNEAIALKVYPSLINYQNEITVDLSQLPKENMLLTIYNTNGQRINQHLTYAAEEMIIPINDFTNGMYFIRSNTSDKAFIGKFMVVK